MQQTIEAAGRSLPYHFEAAELCLGRCDAIAVRGTAGAETGRFKLQ